MKFWFYAIDWRSMAIEVLGEFTNEHQADRAHLKHVADMPPAELDAMARYKTLAVCPVSEEMLAAREQFRRLNGRVA